MNPCYNFRYGRKPMNKNDKELQVKVHSTMYTLIKSKGVASSVEVLISIIGALSKEDYEWWRRGQVDYLERVCKIILRKLSLVNHKIRVYARKHDLKAWVIGNSTVATTIFNPRRLPRSGW